MAQKTMVCSGNLTKQNESAQATAIAHIISLMTNPVEAGKVLIKWASSRK